MHTPEKAAEFIRTNTALKTAPAVPEIELYLADEAFDLWHATEKELTTVGLQPPFWAFAWAGGQALARYILDNPLCVAGKTVLDFASGSGLVGLAALKAGADKVTAVDIDPFAAAAIKLNAKANNVNLTVVTDNLIGQDIACDVLVAGDIFYDKVFAEAIVVWFTALAAKGVTVLVGDPARTYMPKKDVIKCGQYDIAVSTALEDTDIKKTTIWQFNGSGCR